MSLRAWYERHFGPLAYTGTDEQGFRHYSPTSAPTRPKPRLAAVNQAPSREEFARWREDLVTQFVMAALRRNADECKEAWLAESWEAGNANQRVLDAYRERSDALLGFTAEYEAFCETLNLEPQGE